MFISTKDTASERNKAKFKNLNLPILQEMYMGSTDTSLKCMLSNTPAFISFKCLVKGIVQDRFRIDFNHIKQKQSGNCASGKSIDKGKYDPSGLFRNRHLSSVKARLDLIEFLTMMPVCTEQHSYISQSSQSGDITLLSYEHENWPWHLRSKENFDMFCNNYNIGFLDYTWFLEHMCDINVPSIRERILSSKTITASMLFL